jgi:DNA modification methylase
VVPSGKVSPQSQVRFLPPSMLCVFLLGGFVMSVATGQKWHPIACIFPMLPYDKLKELADDIRNHGQRVPIVMYEGKVLDGRNRWDACEIAGVKPITKEFTGSKQDALAFVWSMNKERRQLNSGQLAVSDSLRAKLDSEYAAELEAMKKAAASNKGGDRKSEAAKQPEAIASKSKLQTIVTPKISVSGKAPKSPSQKQSDSTDHKRAEAVGTNRTYIKVADTIVEKRPDLAEKVLAGAMTLPQAKTEMRREEKREELQAKAEAVKEEFQAEPMWTLINQDVMQGLESVRDHHGRARLIFADPPYNIGINYGDHHNDKMDPADFDEWCLKWMRLCCDCLTDDGSLWVMINDEYAADFVMSLRDCGLTMRAWIKWYETFGVNCSNNFNRTSRHILYFVMDEDNFVFNETEVLRPSDRQEKYNDPRAQSSGKILDDVWTIPRITGTSKERIPDFPTQLPVELVSRIVRCASEPGDLIVDPFNGSGTTGVASLRSGRKYVGIDASDKFIKLAEQRLRGEP